MQSEDHEFFGGVGQERVEKGFILNRVMLEELCDQRRVFEAGEVVLPLFGLVFAKRSLRYDTEHKSL